MGYVVTARKWRPNNFTEIVGQEHVTNTLINAIKNGRIAHAYLFTGPRGVGKTTTARILAKRLNCLTPKETEPCNQCEICKSIKEGQFLDIIEIDGASNRGIDEIRSLRDSVKYAPTKGKYKVYIIDEVHMLTRESFNAFLKTLEEPPEHTIFIFATTDIQKVPLTIISRCQRYDFRRIQLQVIKDLLLKIANEEKFNIDDETLTIIAKKADGALRDAESYFDQVISYCGDKITKKAVSEMLNLISDDIYFDVSDALINKDYKSIFNISETIYKNGWNFIDFFIGLIEHFRNILTIALTENSDLIETSDSNKAKYMQYINQFSQGDLLRLLNYLNKSFQELRFTQNQKLKVEVSLAHLVGLEKSSTINEIISKVKDGTINQTELPIEKPQLKKKTIEINETKQEYKTDLSSQQSIPPLITKNKEKKVEEIENTSPSINNDLIISKWDGFVDIIYKDKPLILGPAIQNSEVLSITDNQFKISAPDEDGNFLLKSHKDYIEKTALNYFGKKLHFDFLVGKAQTLVVKKEEKKETTQISEKSKNTPIIEKIISELGGQEIK